MDGQTKVRVTIWQPYFAGFMLAFGQDEPGNFGILDNDAELQREIFTWPVEEDVWAGVTDDALRLNLEEKFVTAFQPMQSPAARSMEKLASFVSELETVVRGAGSEWSIGASGVAEASSVGCMVNGLLAFHQQLSWILDMFRDLPGASVSVR